MSDEPGLKIWNKEDADHYVVTAKEIKRLLLVGYEFGKHNFDIADERFDGVYMSAEEFDAFVGGDAA